MHGNPKYNFDFLHRIDLKVLTIIIIQQFKFVPDQCVKLHDSNALFYVLVNQYFFKTHSSS